MKALIIILVVLSIWLGIAFSFLFLKFLDQQEELNLLKDALRLSYGCEELPQLICK